MSAERSLLHHIESDSCMIGNTSRSLDALNTLNKFINTIRTIIPPPEQFEPQFRNPCWYMYIRMPSKVYKMLQTKELTDEEASQIMKVIFNFGPTSGNTTPKILVCIPMVYFIGFPRSRSTQLYRMMINHPLLLGGKNKEPHWWTKFRFTSKFPHNILGVIKYLSHFRDSSETIHNNSSEGMIIDASQSTIWDTRNTNNLCIMPHLISSIVPSAKYVVIMRDPAERLYSDFRYLCEEHWKVNKMKVDLDTFAKNASEIFHQAVIAGINDFNRCLSVGSSMDMCAHNALSRLTPGQIGCGRARLGISLYHVHIRRWLNVIPRRQFLFLTTEELSKNPFSVIQKVWNFLDIPEQKVEDLNDILHMHSHGSFVQQKNFEMREETRNILNKFLKLHNDALVDLLML